MRDGRRRRLLAGWAALVIAGPASAGAVPQAPPVSLVDAALVEDVRAHLANRIVTMTVEHQNAEYEELTPRDVERLDRQWRDERGKAAKPLIAATLGNPLSSYLTRIQAHSIGLFTEIFVMDENGLNVGQSNITSDFWQGDEAKFQRTYPEGRGAVFIDEPEWHEDSRTWRVQLNLSVDAPDGAGVIGAATFEINLTELARRRGGR